MAVEWHDVAEPEQVAEDFPLSAKVGDRDIGVFLVNANPRVRRPTNHGIC